MIRVGLKKRKKFGVVLSISSSCLQDGEKK